jgi:CRISPR-associated protein Cmx8
MAKQTKQPDGVTVRYDLHELPTAQHKAGLAGLLLQIESMNDRRDGGAKLPMPPQVLSQGPAFAEVRFAVESTQSLFDDLYSATIEEAAVAQKWQGKEPKAVREVEIREPDGKTKIEKRFVYDVVQPTGPFLARYTDDGKELWHKLWRDMLWAIPRGKPTTRGPFNAQAEGKPTKDGAEAWSALLAHEKHKAKGGIATVELAGAVLLGAQAVSAEGVKFEDRADHAVLLHFWQLTARVFVPEQIDADGNRKFVGYVLAIPEVSDLVEFSYAYKRSLSELSPERRGYRPAAAVVSLAAEGSLAFMHQLDRLVSAKELRRRPPEYLSGVEFFHMVKLGNNVKTAGHGRVPAWDGLLTRYDGLISKGGPKHPLMLAGRLQAMFDETPWFARLSDELVERKWWWFVHSTQEGHRTPSAMVSFAWDAHRRFEDLLREENHMSQKTQEPEAIDRVVYRLVKNYVREKASGRMGVNTADRDAWRKATHDAATGYERPAYQEERRHVAQGLFLALRSRHDADFVEHFTATLGSVAQRLPEDEYALLTSALMRTFSEEHGEHRPRTRDDVKTLTLLALSAQSRSLSTKSDDTDQPAAEAEGD